MIQTFKAYYLTLGLSILTSANKNSIFEFRAVEFSGFFDAWIGTYTNAPIMPAVKIPGNSLKAYWRRFRRHFLSIFFLNTLAG